MNSKRIFALLILFVAVAMFSMLTVTAATLNEQKTFTTNDGIHIEAKYKKVSTNKITFNANGGKIGSKKTAAINVKKGAKIKKSFQLLLKEQVIPLNVGTPRKVVGKK
ncbi:MAG: hypothetical protein FWH54_03235 [Methanobrevibacter sp.]|nr:hypothetical protein [Methanobrevibacter sp.]